MKAIVACLRTHIPNGGRSRHSDGFWAASSEGANHSVQGTNFRRHEVARAPLREEGTQVLDSWSFAAAMEASTSGAEDQHRTPRVEPSEAAARLHSNVTTGRGRANRCAAQTASACSATGRAPPQMVRSVGEIEARRVRSCGAVDHDIGANDARTTATTIAAKAKPVLRMRTSPAADHNFPSCRSKRDRG